MISDTLPLFIVIARHKVRSNLLFPQYATILKMSKVVSHDKQAGVEERDRLKKKFIPILTLLLVIAIVVGVFYLYKNYPGKIDELKAYGYLGVFLISLILNATIILPAGNIIVIATLGAALPSAPLVGLIGGVGGSYR